MSAGSTLSNARDTLILAPRGFAFASRPALAAIALTRYSAVWSAILHVLHEPAPVGCVCEVWRQDCASAACAVGDRRGRRRRLELRALVFWPSRAGRAARLGQALAR